MPANRENIDNRISRLQDLLSELGDVKVAVSGGVDSMTLAVLTGRTVNGKATMFHALSPAVPAEATDRVRDMATREGWRLELVDAGEFDNPDYLGNPYDRCFHCKQSLYSTLAGHREGTILSGTNLDDLSDYRPGLKAAADYGVVHPFVECRVGKTAVREICLSLGYDELSRLPASPCLSSRIETGLAIEPSHLDLVHRVERELRRALQPEVVRCRIRSESIAVELDPQTLTALTPEACDYWRETITRLASTKQGLPAEVVLEPYRMGSAFVQPA